MTTPTDAIAIAGLSERLRGPRIGDALTIACDLDDLALEAATQLDSLLKERDALQARVKELEQERNVQMWLKAARRSRQRHGPTMAAPRSDSSA